MASDRRLSFDEVASVYDAVRPSYPGELFDALFAMLPPHPDIVEVGPGTGQATKDLLCRGADVHAVELGPAMASILRAKFPTDHLRVSVGAFEEVALCAASADAVFSATAYHWIAPRSQVDLPAKILHPGGLLAIVDLIQVAACSDRGFFAAAQPIYERYGEGHSGPPTPRRENVDPPIRAVIEADGRYVGVAVQRYDWDQSYSATDYRRLMLSYSGTQMMEDEPRARLLDEIEALIEGRFENSITRPLVVTLTTAILAP